VTRGLTRLLLVGVATAALTACSLVPGKGGLDKDKLNTAIDNKLGGADTCVVLVDAKTGGITFQYGAEDVCRIQQPPCATFDVPAALIGLDLGVITPSTVYKWDGTAQPVSAWQTNANIAKANQDGIQWWWQDLTQALGHDRIADALKRFDYGNKVADGPERSFWLGPQNGGALAISTRQQAQFMQKFYAGALGMKPETTKFVTSMLVDEDWGDTRQGPSVVSAVMGGCPMRADGTRSVSWAAGRIQTAKHDYAYAASMVGEAPPPGIEIQQKLKDSFAAAGL